MTAGPERTVSDGVAAVIGIRRPAEMTGVTARALRYYEARGLVRQLRRRGGARVFTPAQCTRISLIVWLRRLDVPIVVIEELVHGAHTEAGRAADLREALATRADALQLTVDEASTVLARTGVSPPEPPGAAKVAG